MTLEDDGTDREPDELRAAQLRLTEHPGYRAHRDHEAFGISLNGVFWPNYLELKALLDQAATDHELGIELIQNVHDDAVARRFVAEASRRLHNYVAATMSLVEHSRRMMRGRTDAAGDAWKARLAELLTHGEVPFMIDLRVFIQHRALPVLGHSLHIAKPNTPESIWESEVEIGRDLLQSWDGWKAPASQFLKGQDKGIKLRLVVEKHAKLVWQANDWLLRLLVDGNRAALDEVNRIVIEVNKALIGGTLEEAEEFTLRTTEERSQPKSEASRLGIV